MKLQRIMMKQLVVLIFVIFLRHSVSGLTIDAHSAADRCFIIECRITFSLKIGDHPLCGSDGQPYHNRPAFRCAAKCARRYGLELTVAHEGYCEGKLPGREYWEHLMV